MYFIDTHAHYYDEAFLDDYPLAIGRAIEEGVKKMIIPDTDSKVRERLFRICGEYPGVLFPTLGLHPEEVRENWEEELRLLKQWPDKNIVAIGEIGLDYHWTREFEKQQETVLIRQLEMASEMNLPVIIHVRDAMDATLKIIRKCKSLNLRGVFHAYSGSVESFRELEKLGDWYVGIGGVVTFKKASIGQTVRDIPLERIVLETDSPYLTPVPHRGERNESRFIPLIAGKIALAKGLSTQQVRDITTRNAESLFRI